MRRLPQAASPALEARLLAGRAYNEDAAVLSIPPGLAIVQTADILAPIVNEARVFGRIAAANAMSDVYAMGGRPWCAMCLGFFPPAMGECDGGRELREILEGALEAMAEAGAVLAGGHTVQDEELKFGLSVTGVIEPAHIARNDGLRPGQILLLTKPLGMGILATATKARWDWAEESEREIAFWAGRLNSVGAEIIPALSISAATDVTGFGLGGHALEMARASYACVEISASSLPLLPHVLDCAQDGLIPAGTHANQKFCAPRTLIAQGVGKALASVVFDAQTSGGLLLAVDPGQVEEAKAMLSAHGDLAAEIGRVAPPRGDGISLLVGD